MNNEQQQIINDSNILDLRAGRFLTRAELLGTLKVKRRAEDGTPQEFADSRTSAVRVGAKMKPVNR